MKSVPRLCPIVSLLLLGACGTTYALPELDDAKLSAAEAQIQQERARASSILPLEAEAIVAMFNTVMADVEPVAEQFCREEQPEQPPIFCDFEVVVDDTVGVAPNAFQTHLDSGQPVLIFNVPFLASLRNADELAFVAGHEAGHHISEHLHKRRQQQMAGAIAMGVLTGLGQAASSYSNPYRYTGNDAIEMQNAMVAGIAFGQQAYSQTYELEADMLGAFIAERAGYDPERGALIFARREASEEKAGAMSLWSTHPSSPERVALVEVTMGDIEGQRSKGVLPRPAQ